MVIMREDNASNVDDDDEKVLSRGTLRPLSGSPQPQYMRICSEECSLA